ncbi:hypothetical protein VTJ83DRAFT_4452 [Remersonia thermophila]|uniref:Thiaminase-2/PQQC domain-containing protein n=1 Tax=Remersonia thermophila TaxID=72144 RepID=A0ABR4D9Y3_9PEZI
MTATSDAWSLTGHLLSTQAELFKSATQHPFLLAGAEGRLSKIDLGRWLANDRLYIHSYLRAAARLLASLEFPRHVSGPGAKGKEPYETRLADWLIEALVAIRREERLFLDVAARYGLGIEVAEVIPVPAPTLDVPPVLPVAQLPVHAAAAAAAKVPGLKLMEEVVFASVASTSSAAAVTSATAPGSSGTAPLPLLPWLEGAVTFWGTERCYLEAWTWARDHAETVGRDVADDADGGALRKEFIPNWTNSGFRDFVDRLGRLIDEAVGEVLGKTKSAEEKERVKAELLGRVEGPWMTLLEAEKQFWPDI